MLSVTKPAYSVTSVPLILNLKSEQLANLCLLVQVYDTLIGTVTGFDYVTRVGTVQWQGSAVEVRGGSHGPESRAERANFAFLQQCTALATVWN